MDSVLSSEISPDGTLHIDGGSDPTDPIGQWVLHILDANGKVVASATFTLTDRSAAGATTPTARAAAPAATVAPKVTGTGGAIVPTALPTTGHPAAASLSAAMSLSIGAIAVMLGIVLRQRGRRCAVLS